MCVPTVFIREDGRGFVVRSGGIDFQVSYSEAFEWTAINNADFGDVYGFGETIPEAVNNALAKMKAGEKG
jgi:hypothetical protein